MSGVLSPIEAARLLSAIAAEGDRDAFAALFRHFGPRLKSYMVRLGLPAAQADELAQEAMLTVWRRAAQFDPATTGAAAWIFTIARNLRVDLARRDRVQASLDLPEFDGPPPPGADAALDAAERMRRVRDALALLPAEQAQVVQLSFFDDRPHGEIEQALGIPLGTVKSRLRLAMARLKAILDDLR